MRTVCERERFMHGIAATADACMSQLLPLGT